MAELVALLLLVGAMLITALVWRNIRVRQMARQRLGTLDAPAAAVAPRPEVQPFVRARPWIAYLGGVLLGLELYFFTGLGERFAFAFGLIAALLGAHLEQYRVGRTTARIEAQLADALDMMISALAAGSGVLQALEAAAQESRWPLQPQLENLVHRIRYGDDPQAVLQTLEESVPLPTFRLFAASLAVHWEVGGSLSGPLAIVARTIRDRLELSRRIRSLSMQAWASTLAVMLTTYFIAVVMWRTDPERMAAFVRTELGQWFLAAALCLQALGIVWSARLSRMQL